MLQRLANLRDTWKEDHSSNSCTESDFDSVSHRYSGNNQTMKVPVVLSTRVKGTNDDKNLAEWRRLSDSECNPPAEEDAGITAANQNHHRPEHRSDYVPGGERSEEEEFCKMESQEEKLALVTPHTGLASIRSSKPAPTAHADHWSTFRSLQEVEAEGVISCQLSSDSSVDLMSSLSVTELPISLSSSMTSTNSSYTPRRHRMISQGIAEVGSKSKKHYTTDSTMKVYEKRRFAVATGSALLGNLSDKADGQMTALLKCDNKLSNHQNGETRIESAGSESACRNQAQLLSDAGHDSAYCSEITSMHNHLELAAVNGDVDEVQNLFERAMAAEYENKRLRKKIEALERECTFLRSSSNVAARGILEVFSDLNQNDASKPGDELKYCDDLQLVRFSRSPYMLQESRTLTDGLSEVGIRISDQGFPVDIFGNSFKQGKDRATEQYEQCTASLTKPSTQDSFSRRAGYFVDKVIYSASSANSDFSEPCGLPTSSLFFKRLSDITSNNPGLQASQSSNLREQRMGEHASNLFQVAPAALAHAQTHPLDRSIFSGQLALQALPHGKQLSANPFKEGPQDLFRRQREEFSLGPKALEETIYDVHGDAAYPTARMQDRDEDKDTRSRGGQQGTRLMPAVTKERQDQVEASFFMIV